MGRMRETSLQELADTKIRIPPTLLWLGGIRNFLHYRGDVTFSADSLDSCSRILFRVIVKVYSVRIANIILQVCCSAFTAIVAQTPNLQGIPLLEGLSLGSR